MRGWSIGAVIACALAGAGCGDDAQSGRADSGAHDVSEVDAADASDSGDTNDASDAADAADATATDALDDSAVADTAVADTTVADSAPDASDSGVGDAIDDGVDGSTEPLDPDLEPCDHPEYWPFSILSAKVPLRVHYRVASDADMARHTLDLLEYAWSYEVDGFGWHAPLEDETTCGEDDADDVFTWRGHDEAYVNVWAENDHTSWDDGYPYMVIDPWGSLGGDELAPTTAHEFNHMCQAAYDWSDTPFIYEATAEFMEDEVYDDSNSYMELLGDFQAHPDWSLDRDDGYETDYMYGAVLYLRFLRDRYFDGNGKFIVKLWQGLRSSADENEPDFADSLDAMLAPLAASYADSVVDFARWRWYVGPRDDGAHLEEAGDFPRDATPAVAVRIDATGGSAVLGPMLLGTSYVDIVTSAGGPQEVTVSVETTVPEDSVHFAVQALPGVLQQSDGDELSLPATVPLTDVGGKTMRTLAVTALPGPDRSIDPDDRTDDRFTIVVHVAPAGSP